MEEIDDATLDLLGGKQAKPRLLQREPVEQPILFRLWGMLKGIAVVVATDATDRRLTVWPSI